MSGDLITINTERTIAFSGEVIRKSYELPLSKIKYFAQMRYMPVVVHPSTYALVQACEEYLAVAEAESYLAANLTPKDGEGS